MIQTELRLVIDKAAARVLRPLAIAARLTALRPRDELR